MTASRASRPFISRQVLALVGIALSLLACSSARAQTQRVTLTGNASYSTGGPVVNLPVTAIDQSDSPVAYANTDNNGNYTLSFFASPSTPFGVSVVPNPLSGYNVSPAQIFLNVYGGKTYGGNNFIYSPPAGIYSIYGNVILPGTACPSSGGTASVTVTLSGTDNRGFNINQSTTANVPISGPGPLQGAYSFSGLFPGSYTITAVQSADTTQAGTTAAITNANIYNLNLNVLPRTFSICGNVFGTNTPSPSGTVYLYVPQSGAQLQNTAVSGNGTYSFQHLTEGNYGVYMRNPADGSYTYSPAAPQYQAVSLFTGADATNVNFTATRNSWTVTVFVQGLGSSQYLGLTLSGTTSAGKAFSASGAAMGLNPAVIRSVPNGNYTIYSSAPPVNSVLTPTKIAVSVNGADVTINPGFTLTQPGRGTIQGKMYVQGRIPPQVGSLTSPQLTFTSTQYLNDVNYVNPGYIVDFSSVKPYNYSIQVHPGNYNATVSGSSPFIATPSTFNVQVNANGTTTAPDVTFTFKGQVATFTPICGCTSPVQSKTVAPAQSRLALHGKAALPVFGAKQPGSLTATEAAIKGGIAPTQATSQTSVTASSGGVVTTQFPNVHFVHGFGALDPNNPGWNLVDPTIPATNTTAQFSGTIYAPVDGWYWFRTISQGPVTLAVKDFPPSGALVINAWTDVYQTQYGYVYLQGGHQYGIALEYWYDNQSTSAIDLSWQKPGDGGYSTIDDPYLAQTSSLEQLQDWFHYANGRFDNYTTGDFGGQQSAAAAGYTLARNEGCAYAYQLPGTVPLFTFYNGSDNFSTATVAGVQSAAAYYLVGVAGYVFQAPLTDNSSTPLQTWYGLNDNYAAASQAGINGAAQAGYIYIRTEGWVLPAGYCQ